MTKNELLAHKLEFEQLVSKISNRFILCTDINHVINLSLEELGRFSDACRSYVFLISKDGMIMDNTHEWCARGVTSRIDYSKNLSIETFPWWMKILKEGKIILIPEVSELPLEAALEKRLMESQAIVSVLVLPIKVHNKLIGFLGFEYNNDQSGWIKEDLLLLQITSEIFSSAFYRIESERILRSSEKKFREFFYNANDIIFVHSLEKTGEWTRLIEVNDIACERTGYSREELLSMPPDGLFTTEFIALLPELQSTIQKMNHVTYEMEYVSKDGNKVIIEMNSHKFTVDGEDVVLTIGRDIEERKFFEKELKKKNEGLQDAITRLQATQSRLIQQEQLAGIGQLAAGVAHEMNNPLAYAMSNCDLLKDDLDQLLENFTEYKLFNEKLEKTVLPGNLNQQLNTLQNQYSSIDIVNEVGEIVDDIYEGLKRVDTIVKGLSAFSRMDCQDDFKEYDLLEGIKNTLIVSNSAYKYIAVIENVCKPVPVIEANPGQINQVLLNLILNAAYAVKERYSSDRKKGNIKISTDFDEKYVYCIIEDNGAGISRENISKIFIPFFTTKPVGEGTGLGLSIVYDIIVNKHHGEIAVISNQGEGTKFTLQLRIKAE
jgi:PAS domain S-box-containing protein